MKHENLVQFFGVCIEPPNICLVIQYCKKGSLKVSFSQLKDSSKFSHIVLIFFFLQDVLKGSDVDLEWMFKLSFAYDIVNVSVCHKGF